MCLELVDESYFNQLGWHSTLQQNAVFLPPFLELEQVLPARFRQTTQLWRVSVIALIKKFPV